MGSTANQFSWILKQDLAINVSSYFLYAWFAHIVCILEQVNEEILGRHETRKVFVVMHKQYR